MIDIGDESVLKRVSYRLPVKKKELKCDYTFYYTIKINLCKSNIKEWHRAQHIFSSKPMETEDDNVVVNEHIKPGLTGAIKRFNEGNSFYRRMDLLAVCRSEIAAIFLLSCREEQAIDDIGYKLSSFSRRLFAMRQFDRFSDHKLGEELSRLFTVQVKQLRRLDRDK